MIVLGLDVGQSRDHAALVAVASAGPRPHTPLPCWVVVHAERIPLGTSYQDIGAHAVEVADAYRDAGHPA